MEEEIKTAIELAKAQESLKRWVKGNENLKGETRCDITNISFNFSVLHDQIVPWVESTLKTISGILDAELRSAATALTDASPSQAILQNPKILTTKELHYY